MGYKIGFSIGYGIVFLACEAILFLLTGFALPGAWLGLICTLLVLGLCLAAVWKDAFRAGIAHLPMALGAVLTIFFVLQLAAGVIVTFLPLLEGAQPDPVGRTVVGQPAMRSEERRVGKECRSRWSPYH